MEYLIQGKLDNQVHDITYEQLKLLYDENRREAKEARIITESSYRGENYYDKYGDTYYALEKEYLERDPRTSGTRIYYPHGVIIEQSARKNYYRGKCFDLLCSEHCVVVHLNLGVFMNPFGEGR